MKRVILLIGILVGMSLSSCQQRQGDQVVVSRDFPTSSWERFDFVENEITITKPVSYDLVLSATLTPDYPFDYLAVVFTVFDEFETPLRTKNYKFFVKDKTGIWKSELTESGYHFVFPLNNALSLNEAGTYTFQIENHMPITPLLGITDIAVIDQ